MGKFEGKWLGGRIYWAGVDQRGRLKDPTYYIWKRISGQLYQLSTRCSTGRAAVKELERFESDPTNYQAGGQPPTPSSAPIYLTEDLSKSYLTWCRDREDPKPNSPKWLDKQKRYLAWWSEQLKGIDLRKATLDAHIEPALSSDPGEAKKSSGKSTRAKRIAVLKGLYSYMRLQQDARKAGFGILVAEDPTFGRLKVPQSDPNKRKIKDKAVPKANILKVIKQLSGHWKDALTVQSGTGWHVTEVERFTAGIEARQKDKDGNLVKGPDGKPLRIQGQVEAPPKSHPKGVAGVLVCPEAKDGGELRSAVGKEVLEAAKRLLAHGSFSVQKYGMAVKRACVAAGLKEAEVFTPGRMRHSVATHAVNAGADLAAVSTFLNHKSPATTRAFYAKFAVPKRPPTIL